MQRDHNDNSNDFFREKGPEVYTYDHAIGSI
jgi:hypothetical protein